MHKSSGHHFCERKFYVACPPNLTVNKSHSTVGARPRKTFPGTTHTSTVMVHDLMIL